MLGFLLWQANSQANTLASELYFYQTAVGELLMRDDCGSAIQRLEHTPGRPTAPTEISR